MFIMLHTYINHIYIAFKNFLSKKCLSLILGVECNGKGSETTKKKRRKCRIETSLNSTQ